MKYRGILDIGSFTDPYKIHIPADDSIEPNAAVFFNLDVSNNARPLCHKHTRVKLRYDARER
jgi:hypothetical protein